MFHCFDEQLQYTFMVQEATLEKKNQFIMIVVIGSAVQGLNV